MRYPKPVVEIMGDIVAGLPLQKDSRSGLLLSERLQAANPDIKNIHYLYGHPTELIQVMMERSKDPGIDGEGGKYDMYPVVMLYTDFPEVYDRGVSGYYATVTLQMIIAYMTSPNLRAAQRLEQNFKPILLPIYEALMQGIMRSGAFAVQAQKRIPHTKYDRYFWGTQGLYGGNANMFNDFIDAVEIQNLTLRVSNQNFHI